MLPTKYKKEGVPNEKIALKKLLTYMKSVYKTPQKIKCLTDKRQRKSIQMILVLVEVGKNIRNVVGRVNVSSILNDYIIIYID